MKNKFPPILYVRWRDATHGLSETQISDMSELIELHEIGWLVKETDDSISLTMEHTNEGDERRLWLTIPKVNIVETRKIGFRQRKVPSKKEPPK